MNRLNTLSYFLLQPKEWYHYLETLSLGKTQGSIFEFSKSIGKGQLQHIEFSEGLWAQQMNFALNQSLHLYQKAGEKNDLFIINFYLTNAKIKQKSNEQEYDFQYDNVSIMLSSATAANNYDLPADEEIKVFQIGFSRKWLLFNVFNGHNLDFLKIFEEDAPIYLSENLTYKFKSLLKEMDMNTSCRLHLFSNTLQLLTSFFHTIESRNFEQHASSPIHHNDLEQLLKTRTYMDSNPLEEVSLEDLSHRTAMSLSKFKRLFKQVFGLSPYSYHLKNKLSIAMEMIQNKGYSVSEAGLLIGYSNLSQFSKAFKNEFGILPSEVKI